MEEVKGWLAILASLLALGTAGWNWISSPARAVEQKVNKVADSVAEQGRRLVHVEEQLAHLPDRDALHKMQISITELRGEIAVLTAQLRPVAAIADRLQEHMLEQKR